MVQITFSFFWGETYDFYILACSRSVGTNCGYDCYGTNCDYDCYVPVMVIRYGPTSTFKVTNFIE